MNNNECLSPAKYLFFTLVIFSLPVLANVYESKLLVSNPSPSDLSIVGEYLIKDSLTSYSKLIDSDEDGDLDELIFQTNEDSSNLEVWLKINQGNDVFEDSGLLFESHNLPLQVDIRLMNVYFRDLNGDGVKDLWISTKSTVWLSSTSRCDYSIDFNAIYENKGDNNFELANSFYYESYRFNPTKQRTLIQFNEFNSNGLIEPIIYNLYYQDGPPETIKLNNEGNFIFGIKNESSLPYVRVLTILDINNDGIKDFFTNVNENKTSCEIQSNAQDLMGDIKGLMWIGDGNNNFHTQSHWSPLSQAKTIESVDLNNDQIDDLFVLFEVAKNQLESRLYFGDIHNNYDNYYVFDTTLAKVKFADIDNDGLKDVIGFSENFVLIYKNLGNLQFSLIQRIEANQKFKFQIKDMDNDGNIDLVVSHYSFNSRHIQIFYNEGDNNFLASELIGNGYESSFVVTDIDSDGLLDLVVPERTDFDQLFYNVHKNIGDRKFQRKHFKLTSSESERFTPRFVNDLDLDNTEEILGISTYIIDGFISTYLRILKKSKNQTDSYFDTTDILLQRHRNGYYKNSPSIATADFDGNGLHDVLLVGNGQIQLLLQKTNPIVEDIYYDPSHIGHGFSIESVGKDNLYYSLLYSYDNLGNSEWYLQLNRLLTTENKLRLSSINSLNMELGVISYNYNYDMGLALLNNEQNELGRIDNNIFSNNDVSLSYEINNKANTWQSVRLIEQNNKPDNDFSGLWWAGEQDSGWGLSLNFVQRQEGVDVFAILYFYDGNGKARWIIGQAVGFVPSQPLTIEMEMINGYGRNQNFVELNNISAGSIEINLAEVSQNITQSGTMKMDVFYPKGERQDWIRNNIPITLFSKPKIK